MAASDELRDYLPICPGGVECRAGGSTVGESQVSVSDNRDDSREIVEQMLKIDGFKLDRRQEIFKRGPWKNFFMVEVYDKPDLRKCVARGTAFLTDLVRYEAGTKYRTFLTAGHVLFKHDRVVLKHSSDLLKGGQPLPSIKNFICFDKSILGKGKTGWFEVCGHYQDPTKHITGPYDYGAIFVKEEFLKLEMEDRDMSLDGYLFHVDQSFWDQQQKGTLIPTFVAGYPAQLIGGSKDCTYLLACEGKYRPRDSLRFIENVKLNTCINLKDVDDHTADTSPGMSGSPVVLGNFPTSHSPHGLTAIAVHVGGLPIDGSKLKWASTAPAEFKNGIGLNFAVPITQDMLSMLKLP